MKTQVTVHHLPTGIEYADTRQVECGSDTGCHITAKHRRPFPGVMVEANERQVTFRGTETPDLLMTISYAAYDYLRS